MLKSLLYNRFNPLPLLIPMRTAIALTGQRLILVVYHTVCDEVPGHIKYLYQPRSAKLFTDDLNFLMRHYDPVDLPNLKEMICNREKPKKNLFFVSFDDGLREFYTHAAPVLIKMGIPATCFLNSAFIDNKDLFYRYKMSILIEGIQKHKEKQEFWQKFHELKEKFGIPKGYYRDVLLNLDQKSIPFIDEAAKLIQIDFKDYLKKNKPYLTSGQIRELIAKGFTFGAHSIDHPDFRKLPDSEKIDQTLNSVEEVRELFHLNYRVFAFPFTDYGIGKAFFDSVYAHDQVELSFGCAGIKRDSVMNNLQRIPMEEYKMSAVRRLKTDYFYYLLKSPFGKNLIHRF
jgi:peptidoglycan/xylan/chitin deacetylase (PgdA/CDA1 family)